jgi:hypothetical protein
MPPKGKLNDAEIAELTDWVRSGATWPGSTTTRPPASPAASMNAKDFWAFQPPGDPPAPEVKAASWPASDLDRFILSALEAKGLTPAPTADKRTLIRRATFDLTGLPPTPEEVEAFLDDEAAGAFGRVVDRLLASPRYGERWGRHWLDLARYADSNGMDENVAYANAFRFRDYVIRAFNADKPYDQFLKEQIAGDLLPRSGVEADDHDHLTATGFLVLGPKMLAEDDPVKMEMDIIDEQVDTVGRVFMGLTVGCARCHDHKFDPIPTADYYALAGIFKSTKSMQNHKVVAMWNERPLAKDSERASFEAHKKEVARRTAEITKRVEKARADLRRELPARPGAYLLVAWQLEQVERLKTSVLADPDASKPSGTLIREAESFDRGNVLVDHTNYGQGIGVILNRGELPNYTEHVFDVHAEGVYQIELRYAAAEARPVRLLLNGALRVSEAAGTATGTWFPDSQAWSAMAMVVLKTGRNTIRLESDGPFPHFDKLALVPRTLPEGLDPAALASADELGRERSLNPRLIERWRNALAKARSAPDSIFRPWIDRKAGGESPRALADRFQSLFDEAARADSAKLKGDPVLAAFRRVVDDLAGPFSVPRKDESYFAPKAADELRRLRDSLADIEKKAPPIAEVMGVEDQTVKDLRIHIRGSHLTLGEEVPRHFPRVLSAANQPAIDATHSGRLELASWLARPEHPLTARVMVNRLWLGHFGEGLVRSPDNFGRLGDQPVHAVLLDWLARRFVASGWSIKSMHRLIMLSSTYQMSTRLDSSAAQADPENRLHWRMSRRRLEAESIRDAILAVSGELDATMGGTQMTDKNHAYVSSTGGRGGVIYDVKRRSIYLPVIRSGLYDVFQAFDFADPSASNGKRIPTTVAPQALFMMNDRLVLRCAEAMARRLLDRPGPDDAGRVRRAYLLAYGRPPTDKEVARASDFLQRFEAALDDQTSATDARRLRAWQALCQAIVASSEFIYLN